MEKGQPAVRAQRQYLIRHPPPVLILHLKRFSHDAYGAHKLSKPLKFTENLTLKPSVLAPTTPSGASNGSKPPAPTYRLFAGGCPTPSPPPPTSPHPAAARRAASHPLLLLCAQATSRGASLT